MSSTVPGPVTFKPLEADSTATEPTNATDRPAVNVAAAPRRTRKARFRISHVDPWSMMKTSFMFSVAFGIITFVATYVLWVMVNASGMVDAINIAIKDVLATPSDPSPFQVQDLINTNKVMGFSLVVATINVVLITAIATLMTFLYNLSANILGGLEVTFSEDSTAGNRS